MGSTRSKRRAIAVVAIAGCTLATAAIPSTPATAGSLGLQLQECIGDIGEVIIKDDLLVPEGATCNLTGTEVKGSVVAGRDAVLTVTNANLRRSLQGIEGAKITVVRTFVLGYTQLDDTRAVEIDDSVLTGEVRAMSTDGRLTLTQSIMKDDVLVIGARGGVWIKGDIIQGDLDCGDLDPEPNGGSNIVRGEARGQCAKFKKT